MTTKQQPILTQPKSERLVRKALRRFFQTVDEALRAGEAAQRASRDLEEVTGKHIGAVGGVQHEPTQQTDAK
jgi:hypothetical protein